jgi:hypothetical protein
MTTGNQNFNGLIEKYGYTETDKFNGMTAKKGRQLLTVTRAALVPDKYYPNKNIVAKCLLTGKNGAEFQGFVMVDDRINVTYNYAHTPGN